MLFRYGVTKVKAIKTQEDEDEIYIVGVGEVAKKTSIPGESVKYEIVDKKKFHIAKMNFTTGQELPLPGQQLTLTAEKGQMIAVVAAVIEEDLAGDMDEIAKKLQVLLDELIPVAGVFLPNEQAHEPILKKLKNALVSLITGLGSLIDGDDYIGDIPRVYMVSNTGTLDGKRSETVSVSGDGAQYQITFDNSIS